MAEKVSGFTDSVTLAIQPGSGPQDREASIRAYHDVCDGAAGLACDSAAVWLEKHTRVMELHCDSVAFVGKTVLADFCRLFPIGNVRSLILERALAQEEAWLELIQHIPQVTDLRILHVDDMTALPAMLSRRLSKEQRDGAEDYPYQYALPLLVRGRQYGLRQPGSSSAPKPDFVHSLIDCLKARFKSGVELAELRILSPYGMEETIVDKLREVVRSVKWDGVSGGSSDAYRPGDKSCIQWASGSISQLRR
ncbi:hypothetical protein DAEQUDRAFT_769120 [Daedalea quercina L-15889]|uniref:Uncharacterized protein n=1 Tax=Daedalea quercina L-15889 TaxID=1314783 RepID=A0A165M043_9APHY|nr:hypothetical protein DAEQUDRAFT_769120 [Daedalea quercina L-15889]